MKKLLLQAILLNAWLIVILGLAYPLAMTGMAQALFPKQANGSLIVENGKVVGSELVGQAFTGPRYFQGRPSAAGAGYDGLHSNGSNLGPTSKALMDRVDKDVAALRKTFAQKGPVPADLATASESGLDPDISVAAALWEAPAVARARNLPAARVARLIRRHARPRTWGFLGEPRVNVLEVNLALDGLSLKNAPKAVK